MDDFPLQLTTAPAYNAWKAMKCENKRKENHEKKNSKSSHNVLFLLISLTNDFHRASRTFSHHRAATIALTAKHSMFTERQKCLEYCKRSLNAIKSLPVAFAFWKSTAHHIRRNSRRPIARHRALVLRPNWHDNRSQ